MPIKPIPSQYKKLADQCILDIMDAAKKLYPIMTELGDNVTIKSNNIVVVVSRKDKCKINGKKVK